MRDNPGITDALPADAVLAGCREHLVVAITTSNPTSGATDRGVETRAQIAAQNGVSEADLVRANPDVAVDAATNSWPTLTGGQRLLIPVH
ncbi:MAG: LysM peptidoglycan-binding domain-containing protein [Deltaproteobacteria bacterium]|nr:LysM peptidoglycan-binding domain-containing protein [Deltaproteobacteria bacterium]